MEETKFTKENHLSSLINREGHALLNINRVKFSMSPVANLNQIEFTFNNKKTWIDQLEYDYLVKRDITLDRLVHLAYVEGLSSPYIPNKIGNYNSRYCQYFISYPAMQNRFAKEIVTAKP